MKTLKNVEKIIFLIAVGITGFALILGEIIDAKKISLSDGLVLYFVTGFWLSVFILFLGSLLKFSSNDVASRIGDALVLTIESIILSCALSLLVNKNLINTIASEVASTATGTTVTTSTKIGVTVILGLIAAILYYISLVTKLIAHICTKIKPELCTTDDTKIQTVLV